MEEEAVPTNVRQALFDGYEYYSKIRSAEILRVAKEMAKKSHQAAIAAKKAYIAQHKRNKRVVKQNQRDS